MRMYQCISVFLKSKNTNCEKVLRVKVDNKLNFNNHLDSINKKSSCKINVLSRTTPFTKYVKGGFLWTHFLTHNFTIILQFGCFKVAQLTGRLSMYTKESWVYSDFMTSFENLSEKDGTVSLRVKNQQILATEMIKILKHFSILLMSELFYQKVNHYGLRNPYEVSIPNVNDAFHGQGSIS